MKEKKVLCWFAEMVAVIALVGSAVAALPGFAGEFKWQIKNGSICIDSPFKLRGQALQGARFLWGWSLGTDPAR